MVKYIFVTGGVVSGLGKGITTASVGMLLKARGFRIQPLKFDPYLNVDPGTMSPFQHGEVFVTDDGAETDLDLGHYERFLDENLSRDNNVTAGQLYHTLIENEREGKYLGATVQVVPHLTDEIKKRIRSLGKINADVVLVEIGGTVGDIESLPFLEAIRQMRLDEGPHNTLFIHVTLVPYIKSSEELKTKPTQHSVQKLREIGIQPDIIVCRTEKPLTDEVIKKIALFSNVPEKDVIEARDVPIVYEVPIMLYNQNLDLEILSKLHLQGKEPDLTGWINFIRNFEATSVEVNLAFIGKYVKLKDAYKSILEALTHAAAELGVKINIGFVESEELERCSPDVVFSNIDGILVGPGFGERGIEGKITACKYAREKKIPYFGICLGMQIAVIEFAKNVLGLKGSNSTEFEPLTQYPVITLLPEKNNLSEMGGTLRKGAYPCVLREGTLARSLYGDNKISERHRHRYEVNCEYIELFEKNNLIPSGVSPDGRLVEIFEYRDHPFFIGVQFHPEFKSRPLRPHPLFVGFVNAMKKHREGLL
ncbi:MAG TPA: CTP synthase [Candidatus Hydrothermia bacterium]|nr:CTP synthase [Candidatus Hydrothermae bacterium]MDD3649275.1 CTP synthase [Candidatus Hydrothermia bacterium]MDD5573134.1 CTP synthase [Candidatus Hydrothermia bacterium]HOK22689.1 CTP synthase [Candidatus Hydrothermia bacterium]HOL23398.1 CTP synthase [Candidatus Hydrothermia bacterium]